MRRRRLRLTGTLSVDTTALNKRGFEAWLRRDILKRVRDLRPVWHEIKGVFYRQEEMVFAKEGAVQGFSRWDELGNTNYKAWKQEHFPGAGILRLTGRMESHLTGKGRPMYEQAFKTRLRLASDYPASIASGQRSSWMTDRVVANHLPEGKRWSLDPDSIDVAGRHAEGGFVFQDINREAAVGDRSPIRISQLCANAMGDVVMEYLLEDCD